MDIREKIAARNAERRNEDSLKRALWRVFVWIMCGYAGGTIIGEILRRLLHG